jgi:tetratricopeptide (TPR) repeat protein
MTIPLRTIALIAFTLATGNVNVSAIEIAPSARGWEPGAGRFRMQITQCVIAKFSKRIPPCEPPAAADRTEDADARATSLRKRALFFIEIQSFPEARRELDAFLLLQPDSAEARHLSARLALTMGNIALAGTEIAIARRLSPNNPDVHATYAEQLEARPAAYEALREFDAILDRWPDHAFSRIRRAQLLLSHNKPLDALRDLDLLVSGKHPAIEHFNLRAVANLKVGQPLRAIEDYTAALQRAPGAHHLLSGRARAYEQVGDDDAALRDLSAALDDPALRSIPPRELGELLMQRAFILLRSKRFDEAVADVTAALVKGGTPSVLRAQVFLRQNGFPDVPLDGRNSEALGQVLKACLGLNACFQGITRKI